MCDDCLICSNLNAIKNVMPIGAEIERGIVAIERMTKTGARCAYSLPNYDWFVNNKDVVRNAITALCLDMKSNESAVEEYNREGFVLTILALTDRVYIVYARRHDETESEDEEPVSADENPTA